MRKTEVARSIGALGGGLLAATTLWACRTEPDVGPVTVKVQGAPRNPGQPDPFATYHIDIGGSPAVGPPDALLTVVQYCNYQSPFCRRAQEKLAALRARYGSELRLVFKTVMQPMHPLAPTAAEAALAAHEQGRFWEYHQKLYAHQFELTRQDLERHAREIGLDLSRFRAALDGGKHRSRVAAEHKSFGQDLRLKAVPFLFVNGRALVGAEPQSVYERLCDEELSRARALVSRGVPRPQVYAQTIAGKPSRLLGGAPDPETLYRIDVGDDDVSMGPPVAPIVIAQFTDLTCPAYRKIARDVRAALTKHGPNTRLVLKWAPVDDHGRRAARAVLAAGRQGALWRYHDRLLDHEGDLDRSTLDRCAREVGLDLPRFARDLDGDRLRRQVAADETLAAQMEVSWTPTFFVNGRFVPNLEGPSASLESEIAGQLAMME